MKLFTIVFEQEYNDLSDKELILLNRSNTLTGISYFALQNVLAKRGLTTYRIIEIEKEAAPDRNSCLSVKEKCLPGTVRRRFHGCFSSLTVALQNLTVRFKQAFMVSRGLTAFARQKG